GLATASAGGIGMGLKLKLAAASTAALLGWLAWRELTPAVEPELAHASPAPVGDEPAPAATQGSPPGPALVESESVEPRTHVPEPRRFSEVLVHGTAFDSRGAPVEAWVTLEDEWANVLRTDNPTRGSWAISGVPPGVWKLSAVAEGFVRKRLLVELSPHNDRQELSLVFEAATSSRVVVLDEYGAHLTPEDGVYAFASLERPVAGANLSSEYFTAARPATWSRVPEQCEVPPGCLARLHWQEPFPLYVHLATGGRLLESRLVSAPTEELVFEIDRALLAHRTATIRARFVDGITRLPVQGAAHLSTGREHRIGGTPLDTEGRVAFENLPPAVRFLNCDAPGYARGTHQVTVRDGEALELGDLELWPRSTLRARLYDEEGLAVSGLLQWLPVAGSTVWDLAGPRHSRGGSFELREVPRTLVWLRIQSEGRATRCLAVDPSETEVMPLEILMPKGQRVVIRHRPADVGCHVAIATAEGGPIGNWVLGEWQVSLSLMEGEYELRVRGARGEQRTPFAVGSEPLEVDVPPPGE
ncbi:MAG: carboxypeptidase-like regulatory domain-containing protein, partial [Planctomycetota bacterium]